MSVINRMLRDLDQRQQREQTATTTPAAAAPASFPWVWLLGAFVIAAILVIAAMVIWQARESSTASVEVPQQPVVTPVVEEERDAPTGEQSTTEVVTAEGADDQDNSFAEIEQPAEEPPAPSAEVAAAQPEAVQQPMPEPEQVVDESAEPPVAEAEDSGSMRVEPVDLTPAELAEVKFKQAQEALKNGERSRAGSLLEQVIALAPDHIDARSELAAYWYGRGRVDDALAVIEQGLAKQPQQPRWLLLYARLLFNLGAYAELHDALQTLPLNASEANELVQLRASAANELARYEQAANDYAWLAERSRNGAWWLAAAVAWEDSRAPAQARVAYRKALEHDGLNQEGRNYAQQRLQAIGGQ